MGVTRWMSTAVFIVLTVVDLSKGRRLGLHFMSRKDVGLRIDARQPEHSEGCIRLGPSFEKMVEICLALNPNANPNHLGNFSE